MRRVILTVTALLWGGFCGWLHTVFHAGWVGWLPGIGGLALGSAVMMLTWRRP